jgi:hypothetical protein
MVIAPLLAIAPIRGIEKEDGDGKQAAGQRGGADVLRPG